jgi:FkbM family methyltransferase
MTEQITLPNGLTVEAPGRGEAAFRNEEIFKGDAYLRHGIDVSDGATGFDVGANIGLFSVALAQRRRDLKLHLFEPVPSTFTILERNAQRLLAGAEVELPRIALGSRARVGRRLRSTPAGCSTRASTPRASGRKRAGERASTLGRVRSSTTRRGRARCHRV